MILFSVLRRYGMPLADIGVTLNKDHTSVLHALKRADRDPDVQMHVAEILEELRPRFQPANDTAVELRTLALLEMRLRGEIDQVRRTQQMIDSLCGQLGLPRRYAAPDGPDASVERP